MTTTNASTFIYNMVKLHRRCVAFSYYGSILFKRLFKENNLKCKVQVKRFVINKDNDDFIPYHYYIEIKTPTGYRYIIDNRDSYNYLFYMDRYKPRGSIEKVSCRDINRMVKIESCDIEDVIKSTVLYHFENIKSLLISIEPYLALDNSNSH